MTDVLILPASPASLAFGLDWLPLISGHASRAAYRTAKQYRATHLVVSGDSAAAVGLAVLKLSREQHKKTIHSAAQNVARLFATGTVAFLLELDGIRHWLVAVHEGAVIARTDKLYCSIAEAQLVLDELKQAYPQLLILGADQTSTPPTLSAIAAASDTQTQLVPISRWRSVLPAPLQWFLFVMVLLLLVPKMWTVLRPSAAFRPASTVNPTMHWQYALDKAGRGVAMHGVQGTRLILQSVYQLPVNVAGWLLVNADCVSEQQHWQCQARYDRRDQVATNAALLARAQPLWSVDFTSIDQARLKWSFVHSGAPLAQDTVKSSAYNEHYLLSSLQAIRPAFALMQLGKSQPIKMQLPRDESGQFITKPADLPTYLMRSVHIQGPLRSAALLLPYTESISWKKISITLHQLEQVSLKSSRVSVSFQGDLYETQTLPSGDN